MRNTAKVLRFQARAGGKAAVLTRRAASLPDARYSPCLVFSIPSRPAKFNARRKFFSEILRPQYASSCREKYARPWPQAGQFSGASAPYTTWPQLAHTQAHSPSW